MTANRRSLIRRGSVASAALLVIFLAAWEWGPGLLGIPSFIVPPASMVYTEFVRMLTLCQALPGLNGTNMAILVGDHLHGPRGAAAAIMGICLPGGLIMVGAAIAYGAHGHHPIAAAMLTTIAAAAVGIAFSVTLQLGQRSLKGIADLVFVALTVVGVNLLHLSVLVVLVAVGALAVFWYRLRPVIRR